MIGDTEIDRITTKLRQLQTRIRNIGPLMRGSVTIMGKRHKQPYFSVSMKGKTRVIYLGVERAEVARKYSANYRILMRLIDEATLLQMELLKAKGADGQVTPPENESASGHRGRS